MARIVVSQTTTRFEAPTPVTYALTDRSFSLAFISNMRSRGIARPPRAVPRPIAIPRRDARTPTRGQDRETVRRRDEVQPVALPRVLDRFRELVGRQRISRDHLLSSCFDRTTQAAGRPMVSPGVGNGRHSR